MAITNFSDYEGLTYHQYKALKAMQRKNKECMYKLDDRVRLKNQFVKKVMEHDKVFELYHELGEPRNWIVSLCKQTPMRVKDISKHDGDWVLILDSDPRNAVWHQEWFELVSHECFQDEEDLFAI